MLTGEDRLCSFLKDVAARDASHWKNSSTESGGSDHERLGRRLLLECGFSEYTPTVMRSGLTACGAGRGTYQQYIGRVVGMEDGFSFQPFGTQASPDFLCVAGGRLFAVNFKSARGSGVKWNSSLPLDDEIYVISVDGGLNHVFLGRHLISQEEREVVEFSIECRREMGRVLNEEEKSSGSRWYTYTRVDVNPYGGRIDYRDEGGKNFEETLDFVRSCGLQSSTWRL